ncbi:hypothetical protein EDB92DRAFT_2115390 [Lactarius akahatsu]|uniref:Uncharacterized protein n=1 Tax=Lactarius akahatsu TaxID=416441 RepID=A0AAD4QCM2_9AGAM|nr:hypothetical protein EDB92DRAFT_2115390 [Lactarius akahatsu]
MSMAARHDVPNPGLVLQHEYTWTNVDEPYLNWVNYIAIEQTAPVDDVTSVCNLFAQLGGAWRQRPLLISSGDYGVGTATPTMALVTSDSSPSTLCTKQYTGSGASRPPFSQVPGSPISVARRTMLGVVVASVTGQGLLPRPSYQDGAGNNLPPGSSTLVVEYASLYSPAGRGISDIAARARLRAAAPTRSPQLLGSQLSLEGILCVSPDFFLFLSGMADSGLLEPTCAKLEKPTVSENKWY